MDELQEETEAEELMRLIHREYHLFMEVFRQSESEGKLPSSTSDVRSPDQASFRCEAENRSSLSLGGSTDKGDERHPEGTGIRQDLTEVVPIWFNLFP